MEIKQFIAGRAFILHNSKVLIIRESSNYKGGSRIGEYDLPGGKIKPGEHYADGLKREALEECGLEIEVGAPFFVSEWWPTISTDKIQIIGIFFECTSKTDKIIPGNDHDDYQWIDPEDYVKYNIMEKNKEVFQAYLARKK